MRALFSRRAGVVFACILAAFVGITCTVNTVFGFFLEPLASEFRWTRSTVSFSLFLVAIGSAASMPICGRLVDRFGSRLVVLPGTLAFAASVALLARLNGDRLFLYGCYLAAGVAGTVVSSVVLTKVIAGWFDENRGFFLGLVGGVGNGAGATAMPIYVHALIVEHGWRGAYLGLGAAILLSLPILALLLHDAPRTRAAAPRAEAPAVQGATLGEALRTATFWIVLAAIGVGAGAVTAVFTHVIPMAQDRGLSFDRATAVLTTFALVTVAWQVATGFLLDRFPRPWIAAPFFLAAAAGVFLLEIGSAYGQLLGAAALMGLGLGTEYGVLPYFISRYFGLRAYGAIFGAIYGFITLVVGFAPYVFDLVFDNLGTYRPAMFAIIAGLVVGAGLLLMLKPFPPRALEQRA